MPLMPAPGNCGPRSRDLSSTSTAPVLPPVAMSPPAAHAAAATAALPAGYGADVPTAPARMLVQHLARQVQPFLTGPGSIGHVRHERAPVLQRPLGAPNHTHGQALTGTGSFQPLLAPAV